MDLYRFGIDLRDNIPIDPVGMEFSLVLSHLPALGIQLYIFELMSNEQLDEQNHNVSWR